MGIKIEFTDSDLKGFSDKAKDQLEECITSYSQDLIVECLRLEHDINESTVEKAALIKDNNLIKPKRPWYLYIPTILSSITGLTTGLIYKDPFPDNKAILWFAVSLCVYAVSTTLIFVFGEKNGK